MRRVVPAVVVPAVVAVAGLAVVAGLVLDPDEPAPRTNGGWTPLLVPRPEPPTTPARPLPVGHTPGPGRVQLLPPATAPARIYPL